MSHNSVMFPEVTKGPSIYVLMSIEQWELTVLSQDHNKTKGAYKNEAQLIATDFL